jgi:hypothetical protein
MGIFDPGAQGAGWYVHAKQNRNDGGCGQAEYFGLRNVNLARYAGALDRVHRKYAAAIGLGRGYSAHSMRVMLFSRIASESVTQP